MSSNYKIDIGVQKKTKSGTKTSKTTKKTKKKATKKKATKKKATKKEEVRRKLDFIEVNHY